MDTQLLQTFLILAENKSFTKTAQKIFCSQSAVSLQIARLEELLNKKLFLREGKKVILTKEGEQLSSFAKKIQEAEQEMLAHFQENQVEGEVCLGIPEDLATLHLSEILSKFSKSYPNILINVECKFTVDLIAEFEQGKHDLILIKQDPAFTYPLSTGLWKESLVFASSKNFLKEKIISKKNLPLILAPSPCVYRQRAIDALNNAGYTWKIIYSSPSISGKLAAVRAGLGLSAFPKQMVPEDLVIIKDLPQMKKSLVSLVKRQELSQAAKVFGNYIIEQLLDESSLNS